MKKTTAIICFFTLVFGLIAIQRNDVDDEPEIASDVSDTISAASNESYSSYKTEPKETNDNVANPTNVSLEIPSPLKDRPEQIIEHTGYTLSYNKTHNTPNWSAWVLTKEKTFGIISRNKDFYADPNVLTSYRVENYDYKGSGYDRGHMCPAADMKWNVDAMHDCFYMTNMCPQDHTLNGGSWKKLEDACRDWAQSEGTIYIVCGPVYSGSHHEQIGIEHAIDVPEGFFKVVLSLRKGHQKAIGFYYTNDSKRQSINSTATSVDNIEKLTGIDFFYNLDDATENALESSFSISKWN